MSRGLPPWYHLFTFPIPILYSRQNTSVLVPRQQRVIPILRFRLLNIGPSPEILLMGEDSCELAGYGSVHEFHDVEVGGKEDIEVALMDLGC